MIKTTNLPLVSIVTPVFNGAKYLEELIISVKAQSYPHIEHIIINDGSKDSGATFAVLQRYPHLRCWSRENRGQYPTMNEGLKSALGELVCFVSADDVMNKNAVWLAVEYLLNNPDKDGVYGDYEYISSEGRLLYPVRPFRKAPTILYPYSLHISHSSLYVRVKYLFENELYFNDSLRYVGDYDWIVRMLRYPKCLGRLSQSLSYIRIHPGQTTNISFHAMRNEAFATQHRLGVSRFWTSFFRKIMFFSQMLTTARDEGITSAFSMVVERIK